MSSKGKLGVIGALILLIAIAVIVPNVLSRQAASADGAGGPSGQAGAPPPPQPKIDPAVIASAWPKLIGMAASRQPEGNASAPYTLIEVGDFQCPNCGRAEPLVQAAIQGSNGKARLYFVNFPLPQIHPHAMIAAEAGEAAAAQGKFWPMYDLLYSHQDELIDSEIQYYSRGIPGLNVPAVAAAMQSSKYLPQIEQSSQFVQSLNVSSVPTLFVRGPDGKVSVYVGATGDKVKRDGIVRLAATPPWGGGMGMDNAWKIATRDMSSSDS